MHKKDDVCFELFIIIDETIFIPYDVCFELFIITDETIFIP